ncbi:MAG: hypothetical protein PVS3B3_26470 [Ktedonobacteraceae bacterium]
MMFEHMHERVHEGLPFVSLFGLSGLLWLALIGLLIWSLIRWAKMRRMHWNQPMHPFMAHVPYRDQPFETPLADGPRPNAPFNQPTALEILNRRYASGEIDVTTFENMRERILASHGPEQQQRM